MIPRLLVQRPTSGEDTTLADRIADALSRPKRMLFVEDDAAFREYVSRKIEPKFDVRVEYAATTSEARDKFEGEEPFDAAILDVKVTNGDGVWLYQLIMQRWPTIEVIFLTGYDSEDLRRKIEKVGPARVFSKDRMMNSDFIASLLSHLGISPRSLPA